MLIITVESFYPAILKKKMLAMQRRSYHGYVHIYINLTPTSGGRTSDTSSTGFRRNLENLEILMLLVKFLENLEKSGNLMETFKIPGKLREIVM